MTVKRPPVHKPSVEKDAALRRVIADRPGWAWVRNHGGYAQYYAGPRRIGIVRTVKEPYDSDYLKYFAEQEGLPFNEYIGDDDKPGGIVEMVERHFAE